MGRSARNGRPRSAAWLKSARALGLAVALVALALGIGGGPTWARGMPSAVPFSVSLSYTPSPSDPLLVAFTATVTPGSPTMFDWDFGDGSFWNGSGNAFYTPSHLYASAGAYNASVVVHEGSAVASQWLLVTLSAPPLTVSVQTRNSSGSVPLTVTFVATVLGGSGTYRSLLWSFGDGGTGSGLNLAYTYQRSGHFIAVLNVTDSVGSWARAIAYVNATDGRPSASSLAASPGDLALWGLGGATVGALGTVFAIRKFRTRAGPVAPARPEPAEPMVGAVLPPPGAPTPPTPNPVSEPLPPASGAAPEVDTPTLPAPSRPSVNVEALRLSERVVVHLARLGNLSPDEIAPVGFSQIGMATDLEVPQNRLTNVLRRLVAAGILTEEVRHVQGRPRRLKVYRLTSRGEGLARELRTRSSAARSKSVRS